MRNEPALGRSMFSFLLLTLISSTVNAAEVGHSVQHVTNLGTPSPSQPTGKALANSLSPYAVTSEQFTDPRATPNLGDSQTLASVKKSPETVATEEDIDGEKAYEEGYDLRWTQNNTNAALNRFEEAARKHHIRAMHEVACMSLNGIGTKDGKPDIEKAFDWYAILASRCNDRNAQNSLGLMFKNNQIPPEEQSSYQTKVKRIEAARALFKLAQQNGNNLATENLKNLDGDDISGS